MSDEDDNFDLTAAFKEMAEPSAPKEEEPDISDPEEPQPDTADEPEEHPETDSDGVDEAESEEESEGDEPEEETEEEADSVEAQIELDDGTKVSLEEAKKGYLRQSDYTRKLQEVSDIRSKTEQEVSAIKQQQIDVLEALVAKARAFSPIPSLMQQLQEAQSIGDTEEVLRLRLDIEDAKKEEARFYQAYQWEKQQLESKQNSEYEQSEKQFLQEQREKLSQRLPIVKNEEGQKKFLETVNKAAKELGWTSEELAGIKKPDHRHAVALYYAGKYLDSIKAKPDVAQKLKGKAVTPSAGARKSDGKSSTVDAALRQFDKGHNAEAGLTNFFKSYG